MNAVNGSLNRSLAAMKDFIWAANQLCCWKSNRHQAEIRADVDANGKIRNSYCFQRISFFREKVQVSFPISSDTAWRVIRG